MHTRDHRDWACLIPPQNPFRSVCVQCVRILGAVARSWFRCVEASILQNQKTQVDLRLEPIKIKLSWLTSIYNRLLDCIFKLFCRKPALWIQVKQRMNAPCNNIWQTKWSFGFKHNNPLRFIIDTILILKHRPRFSSNGFGVSNDNLSVNYLSFISDLTIFLRVLPKLCQVSVKTETFFQSKNFLITEKYWQNARTQIFKKQL